MNLLIWYRFDIYRTSWLLCSKLKLFVCFKPFDISEMIVSTFQYLLSAHLRSKLAVRREKVSCRVQYRNRTSHDQTHQMKIDFPKILLCFSEKPSNRLVWKGDLSSGRFGQNHCFHEIWGSKLVQLREHRWQNFELTGKDRQHKYLLAKLKLILNVSLYYILCRIPVSRLNSESSL